MGRLPARARPRVLGWHRRGVGATFELHDRLLSNRTSRRLYAERPPSLDDTRRAILQAVKRDGYAVVQFRDLFSDASWEALSAQAMAFIQATEANLESFRQRKAKQSFLVRKYEYGEEHRLDLTDPWLKLAASCELLAIANEYLRMWSKLEYIDLWYSIPVGSYSDRLASQAWHRDFEDRHLLKVFLYLRDVDEKTGPFEFVPGSQIGGPLQHIEPWQPTGIAVSERGSAVLELEKRIAREIPPEQIRTFTGTAGTMIFCDTTGLHRGGYAEEHPRVLATLAYTSPASLAALTRRNVTFSSSGRAALEPASRYALA